MPLRDPLAPPEQPVVVRRYKPVVHNFTVRMPVILKSKLKQVSLYYGIPQTHIIREGIARQINWLIENGTPAILKNIEQQGTRNEQDNQP